MILLCPRAGEAESMACPVRGPRLRLRTNELVIDTDTESAVMVIGADTDLTNQYIDLSTQGSRDGLLVMAPDS